MAEDAITREWRERLERWEGSELGGSDFAEQEGVSVSTLYRWSRRLELGPVKRRGGGRSRKSVRPRVLPVIVKPDAAPLLGPAPLLEVLLRGGEVVRVPQGFDEGTLARVVRVLGGDR
jgi:hypothetical protein